MRISLKFIRTVAFMLLVPFALAACQANSATSTYSGSGITKKGVKSYKRSTRRATRKRRVVRKAGRTRTKRSRRAARVSYKAPPKNLDKLIAKHAKANGVPLNLARAVVRVESNYNVNARGAAGEVGLMQILPRTARGIGYKGSMKKLHDPDTNLSYGMKYLGEAYKRGGGTTCGAILKYNAGHYAKRMNPRSAAYCRKVKGILKTGKAG